MSKVAIATTTYYQDNVKEKARLDLACNLVENAVSAGYAPIVVDGSPAPFDTILRGLFFRLSAKVIQQTQEGMDGSRRQVYSAAEHHHMVAMNTDGITVWTEPEKDDIIRHIPLLIAPIQEGRADIVIAGSLAQLRFHAKLRIYSYTAIHAHMALTPAISSISRPLWPLSAASR